MLFGVVLLVKGVSSCEQHVHNYTAGPGIDSLAIHLTLSLLRGHEQDSAHFFVKVFLPEKHVYLVFSRETEISYFCYVSVFAVFGLCLVYMQQNVLRLEVSVYEVLSVDLAQSLEDVLHYLTCLPLVDRS